MGWLKDYRELIVVIPCYVIAAALYIAIIPYLTSQETSQVQSYALAIGDDSTTYKIGDGKLTFVLNNGQGQTSSSLNIYGLAMSNNIDQAQMNVSNLYSQDGRAIEAKNISIQPNEVRLGGISTTPINVNIDIENSIERGKFHGWFMLLIGQDITSVPLTATTDPLFLIAILWVTIGALISIGTWEIGRFFDRKKTDSQFNILTSPNLAGKDLQAQQSYLPFEMSIRAKEVKYNARLANPEEATKFTLVNLFSIIFGISLFYIQLLSNPAVVGLETISEWDIISLIGIGLGIGSLAGFINKP
jgi:hypothetical protein